MTMVTTMTNVRVWVRVWVTTRRIATIRMPAMLTLAATAIIRRPTATADCSSQLSS